VLRCHQDRGIEVTEEVDLVEEIEVVAGQDMEGTDRALLEDATPEVEADHLNKRGVFRISVLAAEVLIRKKMKVFRRKGLEVGRGVMIDQMEGIAVTADN